MNKLPITIAALSAFTTISAQAAVINIADYTLTPDGTTFGGNSHFSSTEDQRTDVATPSGGTIVKSTDPVAFFVTTFTFGAGTSAEMNLNFTASAGQDRLGIQIKANGETSATGDGGNFVDTNLGSLVGQTVTVIGKFLYDANHNVTYGSANASDDTIATFWINPTASTLEGSGAPDGYGGVTNANFTGDFASLTWNSSQYSLIKQRIANNSTLGTAEDSSILNTTVFTGSDATWSNALAAATVPEPSAAALLGLGLGSLLLRRRRN